MRRVKRLLTSGVPFWTDRSVSGNKWGGAAKADIDNRETGFWTVLSKQPLHGAVRMSG